MGDALEAAWAEALGPRGGEQGPWRVLADALSEAGDARGELMGLQLDAELGPLKGLARGRCQALVRELKEACVLTGVDPESLVLERGVVRKCVVGVPHDFWRAGPGFEALREVAFRAPRTGPAPDVEAWDDTLLGLQELPSVEVVRGLQREGLESLAALPEWPTLRRVGLAGEVGRLQDAAPVPWRAWWQAVFARHRGVREVELGWYATVQVLADVLEALAGAPLERLQVEGTPDDVTLLQRWVARAAPRFEVWAQPRSERLQAKVRVGPDALTVWCPADRRDEVRAHFRSAWPPGQGPALRFVE